MAFFRRSQRMNIYLLLVWGKIVEFSSYYGTSLAQNVFGCCFMTNSERKRRHFTNFNVCPICGNEPKSLLHRFRDCPTVSFMWQQLHPPNLAASFNI